MSYSFDKVNTDRWSELNDEYQSILDELNSEKLTEQELQSVLVAVEDFDLDEVL
jgi:TRAP-type C4-dicarboxylate transport system substrate-binding protein